MRQVVEFFPFDETDDLQKIHKTVSRPRLHLAWNDDEIGRSNRGFS